MFYFCVVFFRVVFFCVLYIVFVVFLVLYFLYFIFPCCIQIILLSETVSSEVCLEDALSDSEEAFSQYWELGLIRYLVICLCLFQNYLSVRKLDCLMLFLLLLIIFGLHK